MRTIQPVSKNCHQTSNLEDFVKNAHAWGNYTQAVFIDFIIAFTTIDSLLMLEKLEAKGIHCNTVTWISSFLTQKTDCNLRWNFENKI